MAIKITKSEPKSKRPLHFEELEIGDIFLLGSEAFIKINQFYGDCGEPDHNCIKLEDGLDYQFDDNECVSKILKDIGANFTKPFLLYPKFFPHKSNRVVNYYKNIGNRISE